MPTNDHCNSCDAVAESVKHYFICCPQYTREREELEKSLRNLIKEYDLTKLSDKLAIILHGPGNNSSLCVPVASGVNL